jgi:cytochrome c-type biogenesis protein CcmH/NrfG
MKKETILLVTVALIVGLLCGVIFTNANKKMPAANQITATASPIDSLQHIEHLKDLVAKEPGNRNAWVQLGHSYFDSNQPMKAIDAYDKALEIDGNDPDVLTDQGTMYRRVGWFDKAINNFIKANQLNPQHLNSLFNMGIVYSQDLGEKQQADEAWNRFLELNPTGQAADRVRTMLDHMWNGHG